MGEMAMQCSTCAIVCISIFASACVGDACDATGLQTCNTNYLTGVAGLTGTAMCDHVNTLVTCLSSSCAGCNTAAIAQFQATVDTQLPALCTNAGATCPNHALCSNAVSCGAGSGSDNVSSNSPSTPSLSLAALVFMGLVLAK